MATLRNIEDIEIWQKGKELTIEIYNKIEKKSDFAFQNQIKCSALSIPANIAEGFGRGGNKEFINFLFIALGSLYETKSHLLIGWELNYFTNESKSYILKKIDNLKRSILSFIKYLRGSKIKGIKFKSNDKI
ncbi:four helix bundle protein [bacterium]|nr:four helix bundle protein [bacterium]